MGRRKGGGPADRQQWSPKDEGHDYGYFGSDMYGRQGGRQVEGRSRENGGKGHGVVEFYGSEEECRMAREYLERMRAEEGMGGDFTMSSWQHGDDDYGYGYGYGGGSSHGRRSRGERKRQKDGSVEEPAKREKVRFDDADTAFILGRGGKTKQKIMRVSGAQLELHERNNVVDICGSEEDVRKARKYIDLVRMQRVGPVHVDATHDDGDLTMLDVPSTCVGFVTGAQGNFLRTIEDEWGTLMFFCDYQGPGGTEVGTERLAIFGQAAGRAGAKLKVMAAVETKLVGHFTSSVGDSISPDEWGTDTLPLGNEELSFALGKDGATRKKLARASGCVLEYVGNIAYMVGEKEERKRARDYITWLMQQRTGPVYVDLRTRTDGSAVEVPSELTGILKGSTLRDIEYETDTFCFLEGDVDLSSKLLIFGDQKGRKQAEKKVKELIKVRPRQPPAEDPSQRYRNEQVKSADVRISVALAGAIEQDKIAAIQAACGAKLTQHGTESISIQGYEQQVSLAKRQLNDYIFNLKVEEEFLTPKDVPFHIFIAKGGESQTSILEDVRNRTRCRVKVVPEERKIVLGGTFSIVTTAKRELQTFLGSFVTHIVRLDKKELSAVSAMGKTSFAKMKNFRHLCEAQINKEQLTLTLSGTPDAVNEGHALVDKLFRDKGWTLATFDVYSQKHSIKSSSRASKEAPAGPGSGKAAEILQLTECDCAFILGRGGKTKQKIARVSGAQLELYEQNDTVEIIGTDEDRRKARKYIELVRAQRMGPVHVDEAHDDGDLTMIPVPHSCVGFVTGSQGNFLRTCEEEWSTLMFFCDYQGPNGDGSGIEKLAIFGGRTGRMGAELKVMAAIETKMPGHYTKNMRDECSEEPYARDTMYLEDEELSFALGKDGSTRKKLARASGCILEYIGNFAFMVGALAARQRARDYIGWLMKQRTGAVYVDIEGRTDVTPVEIPDHLKGVASVFKSVILRGIEQDTRTFCFLEGNPNKSDRLLIFSFDKTCREKARKTCDERIQQKITSQEEDGYRGKSGGHNGNHKGYDYWDDYSQYDDYGDYGRYGANDSYKSYGKKKKYDKYYDYDDYDDQGYSKYEWYSNAKQYPKGDKKGDDSDVTDSFALRGDISVHVVIQTGPNGEDPVIEDVEAATGTQVTLLRNKGVIQIRGSADKVSQAKRQLQLFADKFVSCKIQMRPEITAALANKVSHYIRPMPWIAAAEIDEMKDLLKIQGHQDSVDRTFVVLREVYKDHGLELAESDIVVRRRSDEVGGKGGGSPTASGGRHGKGRSQDVMQVSADDAAFILGRGGKTKQKIARVSGATLELHERNNTVEIFGSDDQRKRARKYVELVRAQRIGPVNVDESHDDGDLTMIVVPHNCVGFVTGSQGSFLRTCEDEWGTLMFFCDYQGPTDEYEASERLAIFGELHARCGAELKVMAAIETKIPRFYTKNLGDTHCSDEWGFDTMPLKSDQLSYALGKKGSTRRKLAKASDCIIEYVGNIAFLSGTLEARGRARDYLGWLCDQVGCKTGRIFIDPASRDDVTLVPVPQDCIGYVMGDRRKTLSRLEEEWSTLIFFVDSKSLNSYKDVEGLAIFGSERGRAGTELKVMGAVETKIPEFFTKGVGDFHCPAEWGVDTQPLGGDELSFALGKDGNTRKKLARASGCILEYVGQVAYMAGAISERARAREYLHWLMKQRSGSVMVDLTGRNDVNVVNVPDDMKGMIKASVLRDVEKQTGTFCFFQGDTNTSNKLLVCGHREADRDAAEHIFQDMLVRGATRPKPKSRGPPARTKARDARRSAAAQKAPPSHTRAAVAQDSESESGSETGSESEFSSQSQDGMPHAPPPAVRQPPKRKGGYSDRRRQWASEESDSASDEEIVPYW